MKRRDDGDDDDLCVCVCVCVCVLRGARVILSSVCYDFQNKYQQVRFLCRAKKKKKKKKKKNVCFGHCIE